MAALADELPFARQERLRFIETMLLWEGSVQRGRVCEVFGVSANHVTRDLAVYLRQRPDNLQFRPQQRAYVAGPGFKPLYASEDPAEYLGLLQTRAETGSAALLPLLGGEGVALAALPSPALGVDAAVLREVLLAIRQRSGLSLTYHSLRGEGPSSRTIWPHALLNNGVRWYARALDSESGSFREFALARIEAPHPVSVKAALPPEKDSAWTTHVRAEVVPHPKLNAHQQRVVAREFGMKRERSGWVWTCSLRQCLVGYFARRYRLDAKPPVSPQSHWVVLRNRSALKPFFLPAGRD
jgi:predicted DNA-binding transcriptional regulator YafY